MLRFFVIEYLSLTKPLCGLRSFTRRKTMPLTPATTATQIATWLEAKRFFFPADFTGMRISTPEAKNGIGILYEEVPTKPQSKFSRLFFGAPELVFLGVIYFSANPGEAGDWHFDLNGKKYQVLAMLLAEELRTNFGVDVRVKLVSDEPVYESKPTPPYLLAWPY